MAPPKKPTKATKPTGKQPAKTKTETEVMKPVGKTKPLIPNMKGKKPLKVDLKAVKPIAKPKIASKQTAPAKSVKPTQKMPPKAPSKPGQSQLGIYDLMKNTFPNRFENANATAVLGVKATPRRPNDTTLIMSTKGTTGDPATYITKIERTSPSVKYSKSKLKVYCGCPDFKYTWAWALSQKGAAIVDASNEDPPDVRNPGYKPGVCKHLLAALQRINETKI